MLRLIRLTALFLLLLLGGLWGMAWLGASGGESPAAALSRYFAFFLGGTEQRAALGGVHVAPSISLGGPFTLTDHTGRRVTERDFANRYLLVYFGYTFCPDVCPTELGTMAAALDALGPRGEHVIPLLITIDPERDTPEHLADYVPRFHPRLIGLTGSAEEIAAVARAYRVYYARVVDPNATEYLMDHSAFLYLVGPDGRVRTLFRPNTSPEAIARAILAQLSRS